MKDSTTITRLRFKKMFCSLKHIFVEKHFFGTAYAGTLKDQNGAMNGAMMGIRQSVLDQNLNLTTWASWKEQLSFGGVADSYTSSPDLPHIETSSKQARMTFFTLSLPTSLDTFLISPMK
ncbi:MAG: hypothetical protein IPM97_03335 [Bdellovibrionaceae bacterium]|nr:hypothetical protein [Pseudobdellovibrionaceae bacterium]